MTRETIILERIVERAIHIVEQTDEHGPPPILTQPLLPERLPPKRIVVRRERRAA
jgi:hypothetical protein